MPRPFLAPRDGVEDIPHDDASKLLDALSPRCHALWEGKSSSWIYRGQANAEWELKPGAVRDRHLFARYGIDDSFAKSRDYSDSAQEWPIRTELERRLLGQFREGLDRSGLTIPSRPPRVDPSELQEVSSLAEPLREAFPLLALAQHHGLPTSLLDWTRRAWVAAYFAAAEAAAEDPKGGAAYLAVWALHRAPSLQESQRQFFYEAPGGTNPNLQAQAGLFTSHYSVGELSLEQYLVSMNNNAKGSPSLRRLTLPTREAPRLLRLLAEEGIDGASMFPGPAGVVRAMRERTLWDTQCYRRTR